MFVACGLNHKTAPLSVRETMAWPDAMQVTLLQRLVDLPAVHEVIILSTCNRTEIYCDTDDPTCILPMIAHEHQLNSNAIAPYFYMHQGDDAVRHVLTVASGLDSMMVGEPQILGQMKQSYRTACLAGTVKQCLRHVFPFVFSATKRIRSQSGIGKNPVSIAYAAAQLVGKLFSDHSALSVFIIGSGDTSTLVAKYLHQYGVQRFIIASRTHKHAKQLAATFVGEAITIADIPHYLPQADVVISATACPLPFISKQLVTDAMSQRNNAPMVFLDLAVPRDIETDVGELDHVHLYNLDELQTVIENGMDERRIAAIHAEQLIHRELDNYKRLYRSLRAKDVICDYRNHMQQLAQQELQRAMQKLSTGQCQYNVLTEFSERLVNKLMHTPSVGLRRAAKDSREELLDLAHYLLTSSVDTPSHETIT